MAGTISRGRVLLLALALAAVASLSSLDARAKTAHKSTYTFRQTYGSALRLVKVDLGLKITDQDPDWGYLMFEYTSRESGKRKSQGSFEFVRKQGRVKVWLQLARLPSYHERAIMDRLVRKLSDEHGIAPQPKPKKKPDTKRKKRRSDSKDEPADKAEKADEDAPKKKRSRAKGPRQRQAG